MKKSALLLIVVMLVSSCSDYSPNVPQSEFYVATNGSDSNPGTINKPFATIATARDAVEKVRRAGLQKPINVFVRGGTYQLTESLIFWQENSGAAEYPITYRTYKDEKPIISGGKVITNWQQDADGRWKAKTDIDNFRQLYVNGTRAVRAQAGRIYELELYGDDGYRTKSGELADWRNPSDVELTYITAWAHTRCKVESIARDGDYAIINMKQPQYWLGKNKEGKSIDEESWAGDGKYNTIENAFELLDQPGEWYLDRTEDTLYYIPKPGEDMKTIEVIAPVIERIIDIKGTIDRPVHDLRFMGLTFMHASWLRPSEIGLIDLQSNFVVENDNSLMRDGKLNMIHNEAIKSPANVVVHAGKSITFERCTFTKFGGAGLDIEHGSQNNTFVGCHFNDISGTGIQVGDIRHEDHHPKDERMIVKNNLITNNLIENCGVEFKGSAGIFVGYTDGTTITHNEIRNLPYSGIGAGWGWGEEDVSGHKTREFYTQPFHYKHPTTLKNTRIEYNYIHHVVQEMIDGAGIYTISRQPNSTIIGNHLHDNIGVPGGVYLDEAAGGFDIVQNVVYNVGERHKWGNRPLTISKTNMHTVKVRDNLFGMEPNTVDIEGRIGKAYFCNTIDVEHTEELEPAEMTITLWIKPASLGKEKNLRKWLVNKNGNKSTQSFYGLGFDVDKVISIITIGDTNEVVLSDPGLIKVNQWSYLTMTYDGLKLNIYHDAKEVGSKTIDKARTPGKGRMRIGGGADGLFRSYFEGLADEIAFYNRALTPEEINTNYKAATKSEMVKQGMVRYWDFENNKQDKMVKQVVEKAGLEPAYKDLLNK
ncbi:LamG-like jellyroll fold domain-containing protein [Planctomycetota bacterium]